MKIRTLCISIAALSIAATSVQAAQLSVTGDVQVNQGNGFGPAQNNMTVKVGDRIMAKAGGSAVITYENSCSTIVNTGIVATVSTGPGCLLKANAGQPVTPGAGAAAGGLGAADAALVGGGVLGAGAVIYLATKKNSHSP